MGSGRLTCSSAAGRGAERLFLALPLTFGALALAAAALRGLQSVAPWLHNVEHNPLEELLRTPGDAAIFAVIVVIAGGVREEVQRAFILRRFERWLGRRDRGTGRRQRGVWRRTRPARRRRRRRDGAARRVLGCGFTFGAGRLSDR